MVRTSLWLPFKTTTKGSQLKKKTPLPSGEQQTHHLVASSPQKTEEEKDAPDWDNWFPTKVFFPGGFLPPKRLRGSHETKNLEPTKVFCGGFLPRKAHKPHKTTHQPGQLVPPKKQRREEKHRRKQTPPHKRTHNDEQDTQVKSSRAPSRSAWWPPAAAAPPRCPRRGLGLWRQAGFEGPGRALQGSGGAQFPLMTKTRLTHFGSRPVHTCTSLR